MKVTMPPLPDGFKEEIIAQFGEESGISLLESLDTPASVSFRLNSRKLDIDRAETEGLPYPSMTGIEWARGGYRLPERPRFTNHPWLHGGAFYVQEGASMYISELIKKIMEAEGERKLRILDLCAAPGGKSIGIIEQVPDGSLVVSNEVNPQRASALRENITKWGYPGSVVTSGSSADFGRMRGYFDVIVVDAPCSGEGMMRKEEVARTQWSRRLVEQCATLQREILNDILPALRPGGWLVYSTCTFNRRENEENVEWLEKEKGLKPEGNTRRFTPASDSTEGLFIALMRKSDDEEWEAGQSDCRSDGNPKKKQKGKGGNGNMKLDASAVKEVKNWLKNGSEYEVAEHSGVLIARNAEVAQVMNNFPEGIRILKSGIELAEMKGRDLIPAHTLALSTELGVGIFPVVDMPEEEALKYLSRESIQLPEGTPKGIVLISYKGVPLGWVKNLGPRSNNLYPKEWKIRSL